MINSLNEIVKNKTENGKELFPNLSDLDLIYIQLFFQEYP